jgi:hypothetical protein
VTGEGLRARRHSGASFCYGPYLQLPAGAYAVAITGRIAGGAEFEMRLTRYVAGEPTLIVGRHFLLTGPVSGVLAGLEFTSIDDIANFETVIEVVTPEVEVTLSHVVITRLPDEARDPLPTLDGASPRIASHLDRDLGPSHNS